MVFQLNPHTIPFLIGIPFALICGIFVLCHNPKAQLNRLFFYICLNIAVWFSFYIPMNFPVSEQFLLAWFKISYCAIALLPVMCFTFITTFLNSPKNIIWYRINKTIGLIFCVMILGTDWIVSGILYLPWYPYHKAGPLNILLVLHCLYLSVFMIKFCLQAIRLEQNPKRKNQMKYLLAALCFMVACIPDYLGMYGVRIHQIGSITASIFLIIVSIAIIKHQVMDIHIVIKKGLLYSFLVSFITFLYVAIVLIIERLFLHNYSSPQTLPSFLVACLIAIIFTPLRNNLQLFVDKLIFKNSTLKMAEENELLRQEVIQTERLKAVATLASGMAHEIKNPLTALQTFSEYLPKKIKDEAFLQKFAPIISSEVNRINTLVHELLDFAKPTPVHLKPAHVQTLLDHTLEFLSNNFIKNNIKITKNYNLGEHALVNLDTNQFKQAILNLLLNAIDAMPHSGEITITTSASSRHITIKIQDSGIGIATEDLPHVFDPFFSKKDHGTGLGLAITYEIIKNHKGRISVESMEGIGTAFIIEMPYAI